MPYPVHKIALIQLHPKPLDLEKNYARAAEFVRQAAKGGAHLAVLPEYHLTNWLPDEPEFKSLCGQWETYLKRYQDLAREHNICIVPGTIVEALGGGTEEERLMNVAYFIGSDGEILGRYEKKNLWHPEREHLTSSRHDPHTAFDTPLGKVGMLICWDLAFGEAFRELISQGAKMIIIPTFWTLADCSDFGLARNPKAEALFLESTITARAFENTCAVVFVNAGGPVGKTKAGSYAGMSRLGLPFLEPLGKETKDSVEEGMSIVELDMEVLEEAEKQYKVRDDMAKDDWHYTYRHDLYEKGKL